MPNWARLDQKVIFSFLFRSALACSLFFFSVTHSFFSFFFLLSRISWNQINLIGLYWQTFTTNGPNFARKREGRGSFAGTKWQFLKWRTHCRGYLPSQGDHLSTLPTNLDPLKTFRATRNVTKHIQRLFWFSPHLDLLLYVNISQNRWWPYSMGGSHARFFLRAHRATAVKHSCFPAWLAGAQMEKCQHIFSHCSF